MARRSVFARLVRIFVSSSFAGGWSLIDTLAPSISRDVENVIRNVVRDQINRLLNTDANKRRVEDLFAPILTAAGVSHIRSLTVGEGGIASILF